MKDIYYIVKLKDGISHKNNLPNLVTVYPKFCGVLVNQDDGHFYFELNDIPKSLVIIPHSWIDWMAPSKILNKRMITDDRK